MVFFIGASGASGTATSVPMPVPDDPLAAQLEVGDVLILGGHGDTSFTVTDSRMTKFADTNPPGGGGQTSLWVGVYDGDDSPITYTADGGAFNRRGARLSAWRSKGITASATTSGNTFPAIQPQLSGASRAVAVSFLAFSFVDGSVDMDGYLEHADTGGVIGKIAIRFHSWEGPRGDTPAGNMSITGSDPAWTVVLLRLSPVSVIAPPCRNIKRGDWLDLGGARNYPPSKMQQTGSRGVGAY